MRLVLVACMLLLPSSTWAEEHLDRAEQDRRYCYQESLWDKSDALWDAYRNEPPQIGWGNVPDGLVDESSRLIDEAMEVWWTLVDERYIPFTRGRLQPDCSQYEFED